MGLAIGVDIGGTKVAAGVVDDEGRMLDRERRDTPGHDVADTESIFVDVVRTYPVKCGAKTSACFPPIERFFGCCSQPFR